jgi:hypothetical protein
MPNVRLPEMVEHESLAGKALREFCGSREMTTIHKDVVGQPELFEQRDAAAERRAEHEAIVRFALDDMPDADKLLMIGKQLEPRPRIRRLQIDPADDADDRRVRVGKRQQPARFVERLPRLHRNARVDTGARHLADRLVGQIVAPEPGHRIVDPCVLSGVVSPEMLMRVYPRRGHGRWKTGSITAHHSPGDAPEGGS